MSRPYSVLNALPPEAFLKWEDFVTGYDGIRPEYAAEQYANGLARSREGGRIIITRGGTWSADGPGFRYTTSYEGIGYHAHTASLLRGFLDGPAPIDVERSDEIGAWLPTVRIKERTDG